mmetsp:Transcript_2378/g.3293  ORF Transcript_2378/g.3293 Transcript_2378/m.3293 type:complete len:91 (-) Transcript_2378:1500-1772(-)
MSFWTYSLLLGVEQVLGDEVARRYSGPSLGVYKPGRVAVASFSISSGEPMINMFALVTCTSFFVFESCMRAAKKFNCETPGLDPCALECV